MSAVDDMIRPLSSVPANRQEPFVLEALVYRLLKAHGFISSPAYIVKKAADEFQDKTTAPCNSCSDVGMDNVEVMEPLLNEFCQG